MSSVYYSGKLEMKPEIDEQKNTNLSSLQVYLNNINKNVRREIKEKHPRK